MCGREVELEDLKPKALSSSGVSLSGGWERY